MAAAVDFWIPADVLQGYVSGYHRYRLRADHEGQVFRDVFFPAWANLRYSSPGTRWAVRIGRRTFDPVPPCAFFGPTSHAGYVTASEGTMIGVGLTPLGWARLGSGDVSCFADRVVPLDQAIPELAEICTDAAAFDNPAPLFDRVLSERLVASPVENAAIEPILGRLLEPEIDKVSDLGAGLGLNARQIARLSRTVFGFTPKLLLRRARFLRALSAIRGQERGSWSGSIRAAGYWDGSHFLRDCHAFLDCPLSEFMAMARPINRLSMQRRDEVLGAPMQSLYDPQST